MGYGPNTTKAGLTTDPEDVPSSLSKPKTSPGTDLAARTAEKYNDFHTQRQAMGANEKTLNPRYRSLGTKDDPYVPSFKKGGVMRKTGLAKLHKGEKVLTRRQQKAKRMK